MENRPPLRRGGEGEKDAGNVLLTSCNARGKCGPPDDAAVAAGALINRADIRYSSLRATLDVAFRE